MNAAGLLTWLSDVPLGVLYLLMAAFAAVENVFPPVPADTVVALGSWLAARGQGSAFWAFFATWIGNVAGAAAMNAQNALHGKYGAISLVLSRFVPGVRALVPPFAGALRISPLTTMLSLSLASAVWYGLVSYVAFRAGADWSSLVARITRYGRLAAIGAVAVIAAGALVWWLRRRRQRTA
jgi:membrane protein DedA with SNARE-associated domain